MLTGPIAELVKGATDLDDQGIAKLHPSKEKLFRTVPKTLKYQTVAEVIKSEHCFARVKVGDKLVFDPFLGSPIKRPPSRGKNYPGREIYFLLKHGYRVISISTFAEISFEVRLKSLLYQSPIRIKVRSEKSL